MSTQSEEDASPTVLEEFFQYLDPLVQRVCPPLSLRSSSIAFFATTLLLCSHRPRSNFGAILTVVLFLGVFELYERWQHAHSARNGDAK